MSDMKCPFCQQELERQYDYNRDTLFHKCNKCYFRGDTILWLALTQAKQDLEIARKALEEIKKHNKAMLSVLGEQIPKESTDTEEYCWWASCRIQDCLNALEQIEHKE